MVARRGRRVNRNAGYCIAGRGLVELIMGNEFAPRKPGNRPARNQSSAKVNSQVSAAQLLRQARTAFSREDEEEALDLCLEVMRIAPNNLHAHYIAMLSAHLLSEEATIDDVCAHALATDRRHPYAIASEAVRFLFLANFSRADDLFAKALAMLPEDVDLYIGWGILHEHSGDDNKSVEAFQRALEIDPQNVRARVSLGIAYAMSGEYQNALEEYQKAKEIDPSTENPHQRLGRDYYLDGAIAEATSEFALASEEEPDEPAAFFYLMDCYNRLGRCDDALDSYETIKAKFNNDPEITSGFYEYFHLHREAIAAFEQLIERYPEDAELRFRISSVCHEAGRLDDAIREAEAGIAIEPDNEHALAHLGKLLFEHAEYHRAVTACRRAIKVNPYDQGAYVTLADSLLFLGRNDESQQTVEEMERTREESWRRYQDKFSGGEGEVEPR